MSSKVKMKRFLQGVLLSRLPLSGAFEVLRVNKNDTDSRTLSTDGTAIRIWVSRATLWAVNGKEKKTKGRQCFQGICP